MRRSDNREIIILEEESPGALKWLLLGAALGAGLALLLAPASGRETRARLARKAERLRDTAEEAISDLQEQFDAFRGANPGPGEDGDEEAVDAEGGGSAGGEEAEEEQEEERGTVSAAREELERRLAAVRARRRSPVPEDDEEPVA